MQSARFRDAPSPVMSGSARRMFSIAVLIASAGYIAFVSLYLSAHRMMWADELNAWNLLADPSWRHAFHSLYAGEDSGTPLFYVIGRCLLAITGPYPVVMRFCSAMLIWLAAVLWAQILRQYFGDVIGIAAVVVGFLCNFEMVDQLAQVRSYGGLVLATVVAVRIALWLTEGERSTIQWFVLSAVGGLVLVSVHGLGVVYSASIIFALFCTRSPLRKRIAAVIGAALSWSFLVVSLAPVKHAAEQSTWLRVPDVATVVHFYNNHPLLFSHHRYVSVLLNLVLLLLDAYAIVWFIRGRGWKTQSNSFALLFYIAVILTLEPIGFGILSNLYQPMFVGRYLLPYSLGVVTLAAAGAWQLSRGFIHRHPGTSALLVFVPLLAIVYISFADQYRNPVSNLDPVLQIAQSMPTAIGDDAIVRDAHYYRPEKAKNIFFVMDGPTPPPYGTLHVVVLQGYDPALVFHQPFLSTHHDFLYIPGGWQPRFVADLEKDPHWKSEQVGSVTIQQGVFPVLRFTYVDGMAGR